MRKLILIDGNALIFRAYYATATRMSRSSDGTPTNALYLFATIMMKLLDEHKFDNIIVALDSPGKKFRHQEYHNYKANRKEVPLELKQQFQPIKDFLNICNVTTIEIEGYEADDVIGTIVTNAAKHDLLVDVYTGDRDLLQLINANANISLMRKGLSETELFDANHLKEVYGIVPKQIIDVKSLMGDASDNIPGVKGIGEKTAYDLVIKYGSLDNIYANIESIKGKLKEKLENDKEMAYLSYELATIYTDVPVDLTVVDENYDTYDAYKLNSFFKQYNIKSLLKYSKEVKEEKFNIEVNIVTKVSTNLLKDNSFIYVDVDNENYHYGNIKGIAISNGVESEYLPIDYLFFDFDFIDYLASNTIKKDCYDMKLAYVSLRKVGITLANIQFDFLLANYLLHPDINKIYDLFLTYGISLKEINKTSSYEDNVSYAMSIAKCGCLLKEDVLNNLKEINNVSLLLDIEQPLALILAKMELNGVLVDVDLLGKLDKEYSTLIKAIEHEINEMAGKEININSPKQLAELLYDDLGLPCNKKRSTNADDLKSISTLHPIVNKILEYRKYSKLLNTYIDAFKEYRFADNRIHALFNQSSTMTGRLSSSCPNLQNLSVRDDERNIIRKLIIAPKNYKILSLDYSQIELRLLAILSKDEALLESFSNNFDVHASTASKIFNEPIENVTSSQRRIAKAVNFGIVYGISPWGLAEQIQTSLKEAQEIINKFFISYPKVKEYLNSNIDFALKNGYVTTMFNRRRLIPEIHSSNYNIKEFGKRVAMNSPLQGSAADLIKIAMINVDNYLKDKQDKCKLICQIHDELLFEVLESEASKFENDIKEIMESVVKNDKIKLKVSSAIGNNWLEAK